MVQLFSLELKSELLKHDLLQHHFYKLWSAGLLSIEILRDYALQYYQQVKNFPNYLRKTQEIAQSPELKQIFSDNLADEEQDIPEKNVVNHQQLWKNFCLGLGLDEQQVENVKMSSETQNLVDVFYELSQSSSYSGLGALYAQEHQYSKISESKRCGLKKFYNIEDKKTVKFFIVHEAVDIIHAEQLEKALDSGFNEDQKLEILQAGQKAMKALNGFLDGMVRKFSLEDIKICEMVNS